MPVLCVKCKWLKDEKLESQVSLMVGRQGGNVRGIVRDIILVGSTDVHGKWMLGCSG